MSLVKVCKVCGLTKPFDPTQKRSSKASGFMGRRCWSCYIDYQRAYMQDYNGYSRRDSYYGSASECESIADCGYESPSPDLSRGPFPLTVTSVAIGFHQYGPGYDWYFHAQVDANEVVEITSSTRDQEGSCGPDDIETYAAMDIPGTIAAKFKAELTQHAVHIAESRHGSDEYYPLEPKWLMVHNAKWLGDDGNIFPTNNGIIEGMWDQICMETDKRFKLLHASAKPALVVSNAVVRVTNRPRPTLRRVT